MFKKLRNHMLLFNLITVSLVMLAAFSVIYLVTYGNFERENTRRLDTMLSMPFMPNRPFPSGNNEPSESRERFGTDYYVSFILFVQNGRLENVNSHLDFQDSVYTEAFEKIGDMDSGKVTLEGRRWAFAVREMPSRADNRRAIYPESEDTLVVFLDITDLNETLRELLLTLIVVGVVVLLLLLWFSFRFAARAVLPIEEGYNKQRQFVADASHELRTPLAIIGANVDAIETSGDESVESQKEWFGYIRTELSRTGKLVDDLLYLASAENVRNDGSLPFNLSLVCETACAAMEAALYDCGISLDENLEKNIFVTADSEKIMRVLYILLDNAGKYTRGGGRVTVSLGREYEWAVVRVTNTGDGISAEDLPKIFDRFYRPDASRSQETGGFGLGLSIAKTTIERSGGDIFVESANGLTTFTFRLPSVVSLRND